MPREKEAYRDTLEALRKKAAIVFPNVFLFNRKQTADLLGKSKSWVYHGQKILNFDKSGHITLEQLARDVVN